MSHSRRLLISETSISFVLSACSHLSECLNGFCSVNIDSNEQFLKSGKWPQLTIYSAGHALQVFVNGQSYGTDD